MNLEEQRDALLKMRLLILNRLEETRQYGLDDSARDHVGELSAYDNHPADMASEVFERGKDVALRDNDRLQLLAVEHSLKQMDAGRYGICEHCGQAISDERLQAMPTANLCVPCKETEERRTPDRMRPVEEEFLYPGYARSDLDETSAVQFDGEDSWQAVARFNERPDFQSDAELGNQDDNEGLVEETDSISNEFYKRNRLS